MLHWKPHPGNPDFFGTFSGKIRKSGKNFSKKSEKPDRKTGNERKNVKFFLKLMENPIPALLRKKSRSRQTLRFPPLPINPRRPGHLCSGSQEYVVRHP
jgi:hypothetical protein